MPSMDICFCGNTAKCPYRFRCKRNIDNWNVDNKYKEYRTYSIFEHTETNCDYFME